VEIVPMIPWNLEGSVWSRGAKAWVFNGATTLKPD
jgi:hypothetical protein